MAHTTYFCKISLSILHLLNNVESMAGQGSAGNVIAALCSFFIPGLGQLLQGRLLMAIVQFCLAAILWFFLLGWIIHLWSILDAALFKPR
jgi:TM2 domain-containing membrane protein YozV